MARTLAFALFSCAITVSGCTALNHTGARAPSSDLQGVTNSFGMDPQQTKSAVTLAAGLQSAVGLKRFVSLAPSNTELLYSLGAQDQLVADSTQCDYPPDAKTKEHVGSFNSVNLEKLTLLHPDEIFLVNGQEGLAATLKKQNYKVTTLQNNKVSDVSTNITILGGQTNRTKEAADAARRFNQHIQQIQRLSAGAKQHPRVFVCVWPKPLVTIGRASYIDDAVTTCGAKSISADLAAAYPTFNTEKLLISQPDFLILPAEANTPGFLDAAPWTSLKAIKDKRFAFLPPRDDDRLSRPTLRLEEGLVWLSKKLHPDLSARLDTLEHSWQQPSRSTKAQ